MNIKNMRKLTKKDEPFSHTKMFLGFVFVKQ